MEGKGLIPRILEDAWKYLTVRRWYKNVLWHSYKIDVFDVLNDKTIGKSGKEI